MKKRYNFYLDEESVWLLEMMKGKYGASYSATANRLFKEKATFLKTKVKYEMPSTTPQQIPNVDDFAYTTE